MIIMKPINFDIVDEHLDLYREEYQKRSMIYPEICSEFLTVLAKSIKSAALYTLSHPLVLESLRRDYALLNMIFESKKESSFTLAFVDDAWLFNDIPVPAITQEAQNLNAFFKTHGIGNLMFLSGAQFFELGTLCEFLSSPAKNQPKGYFEEYLKNKGINNIRVQEIHYEKRYEHKAQAYETAPPSMFHEAPKPAPVTPSENIVRPAPRQEPAFTDKTMPKTEPPKEPVKSAKEIISKLATHIQDIKPAAGIKPTSKPSRGATCPLPEIKPKPAPQIEAAAPASEAIGQRKSVSPPAEIKAKSASQPIAGQESEKPKENILTSMNFGIMLSRIIGSAIKTPEERVQIYKDVLNLLRKSIKQEVDKTTEALIGEKNRILNTRDRTEKVLSKVAEGKFILDKDGNVLMMNPAAEEISGKKFRDVVGKHISEHVKPGEHFLAISKDMDITGGDTISGEVDVVGDIHVERSMRHSMALLEDDEGRVIGAYTTLPEITKFKETQRMQEEFLSRITHDLQTPLSSVSSALEMLIDSSSGKLDSVELKFLNISIRNSLRLNKMIKSILDFSKLKSGKIDMHPEPSSVKDMLSEAGEGLLPWTEKRHLNLIVRLPSPDIYVMADHQRIVQVLTNLISNAIKSTPDGGTITIAASPAPNNERNIIIGVRDTGRGIGKEDLKKVFDKFVQLDNSKGPREGVGLGLSIVNEFISLHGGKVWARSEEGKGSTFYFTLPMPE